MSHRDKILQNCRTGAHKNFPNWAAQEQGKASLVGKFLHQKKGFLRLSNGKEKELYVDSVTKRKQEELGNQLELGLNVFCFW